MKICTKCNREKENIEFYKQSDRKKGASYCKSCFNKYCMDRWINRKIEAIKYKGNSCKQCGIIYPDYPYAVFEFHHTDPQSKDYDWTKLRSRSLSVIKKELDKCVLLCANCHRIEHYKVAPDRIELS